MKTNWLILAGILAGLFSLNSTYTSHKLSHTEIAKLPIILPVNVRQKMPTIETYAEKKARLIRTFCGEYNVPEKLVYAMIHQESKGKADAVSPKGAKGYLQLMPSTAKWLGVDENDPFDNLRGGIMYMGMHLKKYDGDYELSLAAYNAGPGAVQKWGGIPPYSETQTYVKNIMQAIKEDV